MEDLIKRFLTITQDGSGSGSGDGDGDGDGYGRKANTLQHQINSEEYRKGFIDKQIATLKKFKGKEVYYIDNIPCYFLAIKNNVAKVEVIKDDYTTYTQYIAKSGNLFAHGNSKEKAQQAVSDKYFASLSFAEKKAEFIIKFKKNDIHKAKVFFDWHHILTGSCESGRLHFIQSRGISLEQDMSVLEFLTLTKNEYNGGYIKEILDEI